LTIKSFTGDGDSKGHKGVGNVKSYKDLRHLGNSLKREINKAPFSSKMFYGAKRSGLKNRFALSVKARCIAELKKAHVVYKGDMSQIKKAMPSIIDTIILCFKGYCGAACSRHSLVCSGNFRREKFFLPPTMKMRMTEYDEFLLEKCISVLLGDNNLQLTSKLASSQKCEAVNRSYQACNPKHTTFSRTCTGRIHGQILKLNLGFAESTLLKSEKLGSILNKGSSVIKHLTSISKQHLYYKNRSVRAKQKQSRYKCLTRRYAMHANIHYSKGLTDPKPNFSSYSPLPDHTYC
jgi:hypothetical protein